MSSLIDWLNESLKDIDDEDFKGVIKVSEDETNSLVDAPVVVISEIKKVTLLLESKDGKKRKLQVISKIEPQKGVGKELSVMLHAFTTEIMMYSQLLKEMGKLLDETESEMLWPKCYLCGDKQLVLKDLTESGYKVVPTYEFLDVNHAILAMRSIGKYHAMVMVMKERGMIDTTVFKNPYYAQENSFMDSVYLQSVQKVAKTMKQSWGPEWASVADKILNYFSKPGIQLIEAVKSTKNNWPVLNHGDFSMRNMMFHYSPESNCPDDIKLIDYQVCHYNSLANDLVTFLYSSIKPHIREDNMATLLGTYVDTLTQTATAYKYSGPLPTVKDVKEAINLLHPVMFITLVINLPVFINPRTRNVQKEVDEFFEQAKTFEDCANTDLLNNENNYFLDFNDSEIEEYLKYEFTRFMNEKIF